MSDIIPFDPSMADSVARCYNDAVAWVPECHPVPASRFGSLAALASDRLRDEALVVARNEAGAVAGFAHVGIALPSESNDEVRTEPAVIRFLTYPVGQRGIGQELLRWAESWAAARDRRELYACHAAYRYRFYHFGYAHLSEQMGHVRALLGMNGYRHARGEIYLTWRDFAPPAAPRPAIEFDVTTTWESGPIGPRLEVAAVQGGERVGVCKSDRGRVSPTPDAQDWCYCDWLWVADRLQGRRLGMFLLCTALGEMRKGGCRHAAISTDVTNYRAALFYTNLGYRVADVTYAWRKQL